MVAAIRIQWLPKSRNPASIREDSRGNATARWEAYITVSDRRILHDTGARGSQRDTG